jgi:hypothetical protein
MLPTARKRSGAKTAKTAKTVSHKNVLASHENSWWPKINYWNLTFTENFKH